MCVLARMSQSFGELAAAGLHLAPEVFSNSNCGIGRQESLCGNGDQPEPGESRINAASQMIAHQIESKTPRLDFRVLAGRAHGVQVVLAVGLGGVVEIRDAVLVRHDHYRVKRQRRGAVGSRKVLQNLAGPRVDHGAGGGGGLELAPAPTAGSLGSGFGSGLGSRCTPDALSRTVTKEARRC
jgi:hypothetical protein